jgi:hypothetical protein
MMNRSIDDEHVCVCVCVCVCVVCVRVRACVLQYIAFFIVCEYVVSYRNLQQPWNFVVAHHSQNTGVDYG